MSRQTTISIAIVAFFGLLLATGLGIYKDYGISWDGPIQRIVGGSNVRFICEQTAICEVDDHLRSFPTLPNLRDRDYSPLHEIVLSTIEWQFGITDPQSVFQTRNLLNFLLFFIGSLAFFQFVSESIGNRLYGLLGIAIIVLTPRIFAHSFFNTKDLAFLSGIMICLYTLNRALCHPSLKNVILHAITTGIAIDLRIMGVTILCCTLAALAIDSFKNKNTTLLTIKNSVIYILVTFAIVVLFFPHLWHRPAINFAEAFSAMAHFRWDSTVKFAGTMLRAVNLPWYYAPGWIAVSTPPAYLISIIAGILLVSIKILKNHLRFWSSSEERMAYICYALTLGPLFAVITLKSVLYDGWRQLYFIYPPAVFLAVVAIKYCIGNLEEKPRLRAAAAGVIATTLAGYAYLMVQNHPHQNSYMNFMAGTRPSFTYDVDYWGISNKEALQHILGHDSSPKIRIAGRFAAPIQTAALSLPKADRDRITIAGENDDPDYIVTNYRWDPSGNHDWYTVFNIFHEVRAFDDVVATVFVHKKLNRKNVAVEK